MTETSMSPADVVALTGNNGNDGFSNGNAWFWIVVLFLFGWGGNGFGGSNSALTSEAMNNGFNFQDIMMRFDTLSQNQAANAYDNAALINANKYDNAMLINQNTMANMNGFNSVNANITDVGYQLQNLTCGINRNIDSVKFENAQNTCAITNAIHQESEITRGMIQQNIIQDLRDRLEDKDRLYQAANFQISQNAQTSSILDSLGRWVSNPPVPPVYYYGSYGTTYGTTIS